MRSIWVWWWAVVPIAVNGLAAALQPGPVTPLVVGVSGVFALVFGMAAPILFYQATRALSWVACLWIVTLGVIALSVNLYNAIETASRLGETRSDPARVLIERRERLTTRDLSLSGSSTDLRRRSQGDPSGVIEALIQKLKSDPLYARSQGCTDVTMSDSQALCAQIASAGMRLAAAMELDRIEAERREIWKALTEMESLPQEAEPGLNTLSALAGQFMSIDQRLLKAGRDGWIAIALELLCTFMPSILAARARPVQIRKTPVEVEPSVETLPAERPHDLVRRWAAERLATASGGHLRARDLQRDFSAWCAARGEKMPKSWTSVLSRGLRALGYERSEGAYVHYRDVSFASTRLTVIK